MVILSPNCESKVKACCCRKHLRPSMFDCSGDNDDRPAINRFATVLYWFLCTLGLRCSQTAQSTFLLATHRSFLQLVAPADWVLHMVMRSESTITRSFAGDVGLPSLAVPGWYSSDPAAARIVIPARLQKHPLV